MWQNMDIRQIRGWMYNRLMPGRIGYTSEFTNGLEEFTSLACQKASDLASGEIRCPCTRCRNLKYLNPEEVQVHLHRWGFISDYWYWTCHGESDPTLRVAFESCPSTSGTAQEGHTEQFGRFESMVYDAVEPQIRMYPNQQSEESPNKDAQECDDLLQAAQKPLWPGCNNHSELSVAVRLLTIKSEGNICQRSFNEFMALMKETHHEDNVIPQDYYSAKKIVAKLGLTAKKIDCCEHGCMLFYTEEDMKLKQCKFCGGPRYHSKKVGRDKYKEVPVKRMHYLPLIPRLKRLYASMSSAPHMRWHFENRRQPGVLCHPSDGEAWKHFDGKYKDFAEEPRNVRLGLCSNGFMPFSNSAKPYSCWPVIVTPYNLPPELCMTTPYMFLTLVIPGPDNPKEKIDVYLQPLIDELKVLWNEGVMTYDISRKQNFNMKAALMWTVNDFPAYGMLSGSSTAAKLACPCCMNQSKAFYLKHGGKCSWFDFHPQFLPPNHPYRTNKDAFYKNRVVKSKAPRKLSGDEVWEEVSQMPKITETQPCICPGYGDSHNWIKQSIFWELPYWKDNLLRHNLDMMHIEKNVFDNVFYTVMDQRQDQR